MAALRWKNNPGGETSSMLRHSVPIHNRDESMAFGHASLFINFARLTCAADLPALNLKESSGGKASSMRRHSVPIRNGDDPVALGNVNHQTCFEARIDISRMLESIDIGCLPKPLQHRVRCRSEMCLIVRRSGFISRDSLRHSIVRPRVGGHDFVQYSSV